MIGGWIRRWVRWIGGLAGGRAPDGRNGLALVTLRGRFPDAPEHWLEAIAARSSEGALHTIPGLGGMPRETAAPALPDAAPVADRFEGFPPPSPAGRPAEARFPPDRGDLASSGPASAERRADRGVPAEAIVPDAARRRPSVRSGGFAAAADRPSERLLPTFLEAPPRVFHAIRFVPRRSRPGPAAEPASPLERTHASAARTETVMPSLWALHQPPPDSARSEPWPARRTEASPLPADAFPLRSVHERTEAPSWATPTTREPVPSGFARPPEAPPPEGPSPFAPVRSDRGALARPRRTRAARRRHGVRCGGMGGHPRELPRRPGGG